MAELTQLFQRMVRRTVGVDYSLASFTAVAIELAWLGVEGEIVLSQLALHDDREEKVRLKDDMARVLMSADGQVVMPTPSEPASSFHMTHLLHAMQMTLLRCHLRTRARRPRNNVSSWQKTWILIWTGRATKTRRRTTL
jgi:hypothetical protein